jgi:hypothetical protein
MHLLHPLFFFSEIEESKVSDFCRYIEEEDTPESLELPDL